MNARFFIPGITGPVNVLREIEESGAIAAGHFVLSSGLHTPFYLNKSLLLMDPERAARLSVPLAAKLSLMAAHERIGAVVSTAVGAIILGHEVARRLNCLSFFLEKRGGVLANARGFPMRGVTVAVVDDVVTTGASLSAAIHACLREGARPIVSGCLVDRSAGRAAVPCASGGKFAALAKMDAETYSESDIPDELRLVEPTRIGSD